MNELQVFKNDQFGEVRTVLKDGEVWFIAADACRVLEIDNTSHAIKRLDDDEKASLKLGLSGGETNVINEFGLYSLVLGSRKPEAKAFKRWITHDVIPSIRKYGVYAASGIFTEPDVMAALITSLMHEQERTKQLQRRLNWAMSPKAAEIRQQLTEENRKARDRYETISTAADKHDRERVARLAGDDDDLPERTARLFTETLRDMIDSGEVRVMELPAGKRADPDEDFIGFEDERYLYVMPQRAYDRVTRRFEENGEEFPVSQKALNQCLRAIGMVTEDETAGRTTKVKLVGGKAQRFLWLKRKALEREER